MTCASDEAVDEIGPFDERRWFDRQEFLDGLALSQLAPGPLAAQLAMYFGAVRR